MQDTIPPLLAAIPALPLLAGFLCRGKSAAAAGRLTTTFAGVSLALAIGGLGMLVARGPVVAKFAPEFSLRLDSVSITMALLVSFLGLVVLRFSRNYLHGDPHQPRFLSQLSLTLGAVLATVLSGGFLPLAISWVATSLLLHRLLLHFPERRGAIFSARKKFVISRIGDACMISALIILYQHHGSLDFTTLFADAAAGDIAGFPVACVLLAVCASLKSAQFPFHGWLPDTMETPTPVSAFMHAGIVNAGGFLIVRTSPLFIHAPGALGFLTIIGTLTAAFGAVIMLVQPGVKRSLAYSTIAQMGFMILQCGLGAFGLALIHIVAHSLYKAHAFLNAGSTVGAVKRAAIPLRTGALVISSALVTAGALALHFLHVPHGGQAPVFAWILGLALAYGLARAWSAETITLSNGLVACAAAILIAAAAFSLHYVAETVFHALPAYTPELWQLVYVGVDFFGLFIFQCLLWRAAYHPIGRRIYVHALHGFYIGTLGNRFLARLWQRQPNA